MARGFYDVEPATSAAQARPEDQLANAATYVAHQAFHIRKALERIADAMERNGSGSVAVDANGFLKNPLAG